MSDRAGRGLLQVWLLWEAVRSIPYVQQSMAASSTMDPSPLATAVAPRITELIKRENPEQEQILARERMRICDGNSPADTQFGGEGEGGGVPDARVEIPLQPVQTRPQCSPLSRLVLACESGVLGKGSSLGSREEMLYLTYYL